MLHTRENWIKGRMHNDEMTAFCILGALSMAKQQLGIEDNSPIFGKAWDRLRDNVPGGGFMSAYNNAASTSFADIKALLHKALRAGV